MKKTFKTVLVLALAALMLVSLVACGDKSSSIKKKYEKDDYTVSTVSADDDSVKALIAASGLSDEQKKDLSKYEIIFASKKIVNTAVIIKFPSSGDLKSFLTVEKDGEKNTDLYDKAKEDGKINGNCYLLVGTGDAKTLFN